VDGAAVVANDPQHLERHSLETGHHDHRTAARDNSRRLLRWSDKSLTRGDEARRSGRIVVPRDSGPTGIGHGRPAATRTNPFECTSQVLDVTRPVRLSGLAGDNEIGTAADVRADYCR